MVYFNTRPSITGGLLNMNLYHNAKNDDYTKIINSKKFKINKRFNYSKYIDHLIDNIIHYKSPEKLPGSYPNCPVQAPFMGNGIYAFTTLEAAKTYQSNGTVIKIEIDENITFLDLDEEDVLFAMNEMLNDCKEKLSKLIRDEETLKNYLMLVELIQTCLYEEFEHSQPAVGIILYWYNMILESETPDLIKRTFSVNPFPYYLLKNKNKITCISCV